MPNGGSDNCGECIHNRAHGQRIDPYADPALFAHESFCTLRGARIAAPFWTYCDNWQDAHGDPDSDLPDLASAITPVGPIYSGLLVPYHRYPWHGNSEPLPVTCARCHVCGGSSDSGVEIRAESERLEFCGVEHYMQWLESLAAPG